MDVIEPGAGENRYRLLRVYAWYRLILALLLVLGYFTFRDSLLPQVTYRRLYVGTAIGYAVLNLLALALILRRPRAPRPRHLFLLHSVDIAALVLVTHASGGVNSGLAVLLMVTVSAAAIIVPGQIATLVAAVASLAVLGEAVFIIWQDKADGRALFPGGILGMMLFAISLLMQRLSLRLQTSQELAQEKAGEVVELQRLNRLIVQRMQTGVLFADAEDRIGIVNRAAADLLDLDESSSRRGHTLPAPVSTALAAWRRAPGMPAAPLQLRTGGPQVQLAFTTIEGGAGGGTLVFVNDFSQITQQAQQLKLASLGRLTASIAHEIRNPLGSISHAAQLLRESQQLSTDDQRLVEIVIGNARRTNETIESVLTLSRRSTPRVERIRLLDWLRRLAHEIELPGSGSDGATIDIDVRPESIDVHADPTHLRQILQNLCENGLRYSARAAGHPTLALVAGADAGGQPWLDVIDQGPGIADADIGHIFEPFFTTEDRGTGLGLYLARELCEANRIRIEYRGKTPQGSCFRLVFPQS